MPGPLLDVRDHPCEHSMHRAALPQRRLLVTDRRQQGMREAQARFVELDDAFPYSRLERPEHSLSISVSCRYELTVGRASAET